MPKEYNYDVTVVRIAYSSMVISVKAANKKEAEEKALVVAPDREFSNAYAAEYETSGVIWNPE